LVQLRLCQNTEVREQHLHAGNPLAGAPDVPALAPISAPRARKAVVSTKNDRAAAQQINGFPVLQDGPANGTVADIKRQFQVGDAAFSRRNSFRRYFLGIHGWFWFNGIVIKTKLDNANWFTIRHADTPVQKRFFGKPGRTQIRLGLLFLPNALSFAHIHAFGCFVVTAQIIRFSSPATRIK